MIGKETKNNSSSPNTDQETKAATEQKDQSVNSHFASLEKSLSEVEMSLQHLENYLSQTHGSQESLQYWEQQILKLNNLSSNTVTRVNNVPLTQMNEFVRRPLVTLIRT